MRLEPCEATYSQKLGDLLPTSILGGSLNIDSMFLWRDRERERESVLVRDVLRVKALCRPSQGTQLQPTVLSRVPTSCNLAKIERERGVIAICKCIRI